LDERLTRLWNCRG